MSAASLEKWTEQLMDLAGKIGGIKARQLSREQRQKARSKDLERRLMARRHALIAEATRTAGLAEWSVPEILGVLLDARERIGHSPTLRLAARKRAEQHAITMPVRSSLRVCTLDAVAERASAERDGDTAA